METIYYDMLEVKDEIKSFVNIDRFGDLYYKKMTLAEYSRKVFNENHINAFYRISHHKDLASLIDKISYSDNDEFIFLSSNLTIVNKESFAVFLKKIKYVESSLVVCGCDCAKPLLKMSKKEAIDFLNLIKNNDGNLYHLLEQKSESLEKFGQENFYHEIKSYTDFVTYLQSNFELRYFNSIQSTRNILTKRSEQKEKMLKEYSYYSILPDDMRLFFIPPFNFKEHESYAEYSMERLHILDVSVQWIHLSINNSEFKNLIERLFDFIQSRKQKNVTEDTLQAIANNSYLQKLEERITQFKATIIYKQINDIISNSTCYASLDDVILKYKNLLKDVSTEKGVMMKPVISHGDLCFSNILYDKRISFIKLIDPKGCLNENEAYMDAYYDIAKLSHSVLGNYDFINNGIFEIKYDNQMKVYLEIPYQDNLAEKQMIFKDILKEHKLSYRKVRLYEASLFLSMLPLHIDYPKKILAFILTAVKILEELDK